MEDFTEEHSKSLLSKEWLVQIDGQTSTPYLLKFHMSEVDSSCCILVTDTKATWTEVLSSNRFARRWRICNKSSEEFASAEEEDQWRAQRLHLLSEAHTLGGITDLTFELVDSKYSDAAFELECETFKWRWETFLAPPKISAELISKHLLMPFISLSHVAFAPGDPVSDLSQVSLESAVDKMSRTARRSMDTHLKNAMSKPRVATALRRVTAMLNFIPDPPPIRLEVDKPKLHIPGPTLGAPPDDQVEPRARGAPEIIPSVPPVQYPVLDVEMLEVDAIPHAASPDPAHQIRSQDIPDDGSTTESSDDNGPQPAYVTNLKGKAAGLQVAAKKSNSPAPPVKGEPSDGSDDPVAAHRLPAKKARAAIASSSDENVSVPPPSNLKSGMARGTRQPIRRGGKRF